MVKPSLGDVFPGLRGQPYTITSARDGRYNCIAWAAGYADRWWWPDEDDEDNWPPGLARVETVAAFHDLFASLGYTVCNDETLELGYEKVAVFALTGVPKPFDTSPPRFLG